MQIFNTDIKFNTFLKKGVKSMKDDWGVYCVTGYQGSGKTYYAIYLTSQIVQGRKVKTNIKSLKMDNTELEYFSKLEEVYDDVEEDKIFIIDEISKKYSKNAYTDKDFYAWLQQSRKRHRIVFLITQEWKEVPMWLRRPCRYMFVTKKIPIIPLFCTTVGDALNMEIDPLSMEWVCPVIKRVIYKRNKCIANMYDTLEPITDL